MNKIDWNVEKNKSAVAGFTVFILIFILALYLLQLTKLSGAEFVALIIAFAIIGCAIAFSSEIQEFSVVGNVVKFREIRKDAENIIEQLKLARLDILKYSLAGVIGDRRYVDQKLAAIDLRIERYFLMVQIAEKQKVAEQMSFDLAQSAEILLTAIVNHLRERMIEATINLDADRIYTAVELAAIFLEEKNLINSNRELELEAFKGQIIETLEVYANLFNLYKKYLPAKID